MEGQADGRQLCAKCARSARSWRGKPTGPGHGGRRSRRKGGRRRRCAQAGAVFRKVYGEGESSPVAVALGGAEAKRAVVAPAVVGDRRAGGLVSRWACWIAAGILGVEASPGD